MIASSLQEIIVCLGYPVAGNPTQFVMERAFEAAGFDSRCLTADVAPGDLAAAIAGMRAMGFRGGIVEPPHQRSVGPLLDDLSEAAATLGEADLVYRTEDGPWHGDHTWVHAVTELLAARMDIAGKRVVILGTGPLAGGAALAVQRAGAARITIVTHDDLEGDDLAQRLSQQQPEIADVQNWPDLYCIPSETDILIQGHTSEGEEVPLALDLDSLLPEMLIFDSSVTPAQTELLSRARTLECANINGLELLVQRAVVAFRRWTRREPDRAVVAEAFEEFLMI